MTPTNPGRTFGPGQSQRRHLLGPTEATDQAIIVQGLVERAGAKLVGESSGMPVVRDRDGNFFAVTPTGATLRAIKTR